METAISARLLALLRCPESRQGLSLATAEQIATMEAARLGGALRNRSGELLSQPITAALIRADGAILYPVRDGIPVLLPDEAVELVGLAD